MVVELLQDGRCDPTESNSRCLEAAVLGRYSRIVVYC